MDHATLRELAAGAALDDLDPDERRILEAHLADCPPCARLSAELDDVLADLVLVAPEMRPPASLLPELRAALTGMSTALAPAASGGGTIPFPLGGERTRPPRAGDARSPRRGRSGGRLTNLAGLAAAAAFAIIAVALGMRAQALDTQLAAAQLELQQEQAILATMADPDRRTASLEAPAGPAATVVWVPGGDAWLLADGLPATPDGRVYQLWHADASGVHPLGTFTHDGSGTLVAAFGVDLADSVAAMVTLEPVGGAVGEPGPEIVFGELTAEG